MGKTRKGINYLRLVCFIQIFFHAACFCPYGFRFRTTDESCCKPIQCKINQGFTLCSSLDSPGYDSCYDCPSGTFHEFPTDTSDYTFSINVCRKNDCDCLPEAEIQNSEECKVNGEKKVCVCKRWELYYGDDPALCKGPLNDAQKLELLSQPGFELKNNGEVAECEIGYYKNRSDHSICRPHSKCLNGYFKTFNGSTTQDIKCQRVTTTTPLATTTTPLATTTAPLATTSRPKLSTTTIFSISEETKGLTRMEVKMLETENTVGNDTSIGQSGSSKERHEEESKTIITVLVASLVPTVFLVLLVVLIICLCCHKKRREKAKHSGSEQSMCTGIIMEEIKRPMPDECGSDKPVEPSTTEENDPLLNALNEHSSSQEVSIHEMNRDSDGKTHDKKVPNGYSKADNSSDNGDLTESKLCVESYYLQNENHCTNDFHDHKETHEMKLYEDEFEPEKQNNEMKSKDNAFVIGDDSHLKKTQNMKNDEDECQPLYNEMQKGNNTSLTVKDQSLSSYMSNSLSLLSDSRPPNNLGSLQSSGLYSTLSIDSLNKDSPHRVVLSGSDSDYGTDSSQNNETRRSDLSTLNSDIPFHNLYSSSLLKQEGRESSTCPTGVQYNVAIVQPYQENGHSKEKAVAVVRPLNFEDGKEFEETVDLDQTHSKTP